MIIKIITTLYCLIVKTLIRFGFMASIFLRKRIFKTEIILVACMPKSGSTYVSGKIANLKNWKHVDFVPSYGQREQEICAYTALFKSLVYINRNIVAQHHVRLSDGTARVVNRLGIKVIILTRDIEDCLNSIVDHMHNESYIFPAGFWSKELSDASIANGISEFEAIVRTNIGWYVNFYVSWSQYGTFDINTDAVAVKYEEFFENPTKNLKQILDELNISYSIPNIQDTINAQTKDRKNKGIHGIGHEKLESNTQLKEHIECLYSCYPGINFHSKIKINT